MQLPATPASVGKQVNVPWPREGESAFDHGQRAVATVIEANKVIKRDAEYVVRLKRAFGAE